MFGVATDRHIFLVGANNIYSITVYTVARLQIDTNRTEHRPSFDKTVTDRK